MFCEISRRLGFKKSVWFQSFGVNKPSFWTCSIFSGITGRADGWGGNKIICSSVRKSLYLSFLSICLLHQIKLIRIRLAAPAVYFRGFGGMAL